MSIKFFNEEINYQLQGRKKIKQWIADTISNERAVLGDINFIFTSDNYLLEVNKQYLSHNYFTDIITFDYCTDELVHGDIYISVDTVKNNSTRFAVSFKEELFRVMIHGILHLLGYNDQNQEQKREMKEKENFYLERFKKLS